MRRIIGDVLPRRLREVELIARADDRGDPVLQIAPPLISDEAILEDLVMRMRAALSLTGDEIGVTAGT